MTNTTNTAATQTWTPETLTAGLYETQWGDHIRILANGTWRWRDDSDWFGWEPVTALTAGFANTQGWRRSDWSR